MIGSSTRTLTARYVAALATVAALSIAGQVLVQTLLTTHEADSRVINLAGRQRMLSQRIVKNALTLGNASTRQERIQELQHLTAEWARVHEGLRHGDVAQGLPGRNSVGVAATFRAIDASFAAMMSAVSELLHDPDNAHAAIERLLAHEVVFLDGMDKIVSLYERESRQRVRTLQRVELGLLMLVLVTLLLEGLFVFRPTVGRIHRAMTILRQSESEKAAILRAMPDMLLRVDTTGVVREAYQPEGAPLAERSLVGRTIEQVFVEQVFDGPEARSCCEHLRNAMAKGQDTRFEYQQQRGGTTRYFEVRLVPYGESDALLIVRDLTERRRLEMEILDISEREQARIGQDLHDGLCQHLAGLAFMARSVANQAQHGKGIDKQELSSLADLVQQGLVLARQMSRGLYPAVLVERGLGAALSELATMASTLHKVSCIAHVELECQSLDQSVAFQLYRIAQEALTNAIRHGHASDITLSIAMVDGWLTMRIQDNGTGLPRREETPTTGGMGLRSMATRARMIDARLEIGAREPSGTVVECRLPGTAAGSS